MATAPTLTAKDLTGVIAYMPTTIRDDLEMTPRVKDPVNLEEAARATDALIEDGCSGICLNGTFGEVSSLLAEEIYAFTATVIEAAADRVPVFAGATTLNTRDTIARAKAFRDLGATGLMLGRPMMSAMGDGNIVRYYQDVAAEVPELAIFLYDDAEAFKRPIGTDVYRELAKIPQIIGCKYRSRLLVGGLAYNTYEKDVDAVDGNIRLLTHELDFPYANKLVGEDTMWSSAVGAGPAPIFALREAVLQERWDEVKAIHDDLLWTFEGMIPREGFENWHVTKIAFMKARFVAAGYINAGPALPPYTWAPEQRLETARELGRRAKEMQQKYAERKAAGVPS